MDPGPARGRERPPDAVLAAYAPGSSTEGSGRLLTADVLDYAGNAQPRVELLAKFSTSNGTMKAEVRFIGGPRSFHIHRARDRAGSPRGRSGDLIRVRAERALFDCAAGVSDIRAIRLCPGTRPDGRALHEQRDRSGIQALCGDRSTSPLSGAGLDAGRHSRDSAGHRRHYHTDRIRPQVLFVRAARVHDSLEQGDSRLLRAE